MTNGDQIRSWDDLTLARWLVSVEKEAIIHQPVVDAMSEEALVDDWVLFLAKENDYGKTYNS